MPLSLISSAIQKVYNFLAADTKARVRRIKKLTIISQLIIPLFAVGFIALIKTQIDEYVGTDIPFLLFSIAVAFCAWYGGAVSSLFAVFLSALTSAYLFMNSPQDTALTANELVSLLFFIVQGVVITITITVLEQALDIEQETTQELLTYQIEESKQQNYLTHILESINDGFVTFDIELRYLYVNKRAEEMMGKSQAEVVGRKAIDLFPESANTPFYMAVNKALKTKRPIRIEYFSPVAKVWLENRIYPFDFGVSAFFTDITKRKKIDQQLKESELRLKRLVESNIIGVAVEDISGNIIDANQLFLDLIGYTKEDLKKGIRWTALSSPETEEMELLKTKELLKSGVVEPYEKEYVRKNGNRIIALKGGALLDAEAGTVIVFTIDLSEQKKEEKRKDEFISVASHELKTPLTSIKAFTQLLQKYMAEKKDDKALDYLTRVNGQINRLTRLIEELLDVSRIQEGRLQYDMKEFDLGLAIRKVTEDIQVTTDTHKIIYKGRAGINLIGDEYRICQAVTNLINNGLTYSRNANKLKVSVSAEPSEALITVQDYGIGIPPDSLKNIFQKFYRLSDENRGSYPGLGLGLFIASEIVKRHNGDITVTSIVNKGSTFSIHLPLEQNS